MSSGEMIALVCVLSLLPLWAAGSIVLFALGTVRCGRLIDPYWDDHSSSGGRGDHCPLDPDAPRDDRGVEGPEDAGPGRVEGDWWPQFERELGRYVEERESCPSGHGADADRAAR
jgi:hypothetical protein